MFYLVSTNKPTGRCSSRTIFPLLRKGVLDLERLAESDKGNLSQYYISPGPAHTILAQTCISTLLQLDNRIRNITTAFPLPNMLLVTGFTMLGVMVWHPRYRTGWSAF
jgi:hypothetical protein